MYQFHCNKKPLHFLTPSSLEKIMFTIANAYFKLLKIIIVLCLAAMVVMVFSNVILRYIFNTGFPISEELSRWCFVWMTFLGAIIVLREQGHLGVDMLVQIMSKPLRKICLIITHLMMLYVGALIFLGSWEQTLLNMDSQAPASGLSMAWFFSVGVIFSASSIIILLYQLVLIVKAPVAGIDEVLPKKTMGAE